MTKEEQTGPDATSTPGMNRQNGSTVSTSDKITVSHMYTRIDSTGHAVAIVQVDHDLIHALETYWGKTAAQEFIHNRESDGMTWADIRTDLQEVVLECRIERGFRPAEWEATQ